MPRKRGVDKKTLVEDNELFIFDDEVQSILTVLCGKTLEVSRMEVLEEEELREMKEQQDHYKRMLAAEVADIKRMEENEAKRLADFEKLKGNMREKKKNKQLAHRKVVARTIAKGYLANLRENTYKKLTDVGFYTNTFKIDVLDNDVVPWLHSKAFEFVQDLEIKNSMPTSLAQGYLKSEQDLHTQTVKAEVLRKQAVKEEQERQMAIKQEEKRKRKEAREAKKRAEELAALKAEIQAGFIEKGSSVADVAVQEIMNLDGFDSKEPVIGSMGGLLGQIIITLGIIEKNFNRQLTSKSTKSKKSSKSGKSKKTNDDKKS